MNSSIVAIGVANPEYKVPQETIFNFMSKAHQLNDVSKDRLHKIYQHSGIDTRYSVIADFGANFGDYHFFPNTENLEPFPSTSDRLKLYEEKAISICLKAVRNCISKTDISLKDVTHLITVSCTGMHAPGIDIELVEQLGLALNVERTCINFMGCYGAFNALKMADYICQTDEKAIVLIVDVELCTLHFQKENNLNNWVANAIFADGAAAVIVQHKQSSKGKGLQINKFYSELVTAARDDMAWRIGDSGFEMRLSTQISKKIKTKILDIANKALTKANITLEEVDYFAIHPGGRRILEVCEEEFSNCIDMNKYSYQILKEYGNMSSATILFVLELMMKNFNPNDKGKKILSFAFGPGLTFESVVLEII